MVVRGVVTNVDPNAMAGRYPVTQFEIQTDGGQQKKWKIFKKNALVNTANRLIVGQNVEVELVKEGEYWNPKSITVLPDAPVSSASVPTANNGGPYSRPDRDTFRSKEELRRTDALNAAIRFATIVGVEVQVDYVLNLAEEFAEYFEKGPNAEVAANLLDDPEN